MAIGDFYGTIARNRVSKLLCYFLGVPDFHTHLRIKPMLKFLKKYFYATKSATINILELGCGSGINGFEISKLSMRFGKKLNYVGVDLSEESIKIARRISEKFEGNTKLKFSFYNSDANIFLQNYKDNYFDIVLLIDFIEHIGSPEITLRLANKKLRAGGLFLVSVPTPLYPKVFGRKFHEKIGHLVDGYTINLLDALFEGINCNRLSYEYNTGLIGSFACWVYYNKLGDERIRNKYINFISWLVLYPLKFLDIFNGPRISCSLFAVYKKK